MLVAVLTLMVSLAAAPPATADTAGATPKTSAVPLPISLPGTFVATNTAINTPRAPSGGPQYWNNVGFYRWTAPQNLNVVIRAISITPAGWDNTLEVWTGPGFTTLVTQNDDRYRLDAQLAFTATAGTTYAIGMGGYGTWSRGSAYLQFTTAAPDKPTNVVAAPGQNSAVVSWNQPLASIQAVSEYRIHRYVNGVEQGVTSQYGSPPTTFATINGLTAGTPYTFRVEAINANGSSGLSNPSAPISPTNTVTAPAAPVINAATAASSNSVDIVVNASPQGGLPATYLVTVSPGGSTCTVYTSYYNSCGIGGLAPGTNYTFTATATNTAGTSPASAAYGPVTVGLPSPPQIGTPTIGNGQIFVPISAGSTGGTPATYTVTASPGGALCSFAVPDTGCAVTGLTNDTEYTFTATAANNAGSSTPSPAAGPFSPVGIEPPGAPAQPTVTPQTESAVVHWDEPTTGGTALSYTATATPGGNYCTATAPNTECTIPGLINGQTYTFAVVAANLGGSSSSSPASDGVTPQAVPAIPVTPAVTVGDGEAVVTITPNTGGAPVDSYTVTAIPGGETCTVDADANPLHCTVGNLQNLESYTFSVTAANPAATSDSSEASSPVVVGPAATPGTPVAVNGDTRARVSFAAATDGGTPDGYTITAEPGGASCTVDRDADPLGCVVEGLENGTTYSFTVTATNAAGTTDPSEPSNEVTPVLTPAVPGPPEVSVSNGRAAVTITPGDGGGPVDSYLVTADPGGLTCSVAADANPLSCVIEGLDNDVAYTFSVAAVNSGGDSSASQDSREVVVGDVEVPGPPTVSVGDEAAVITITPATGGGTPDSYTVTASPGGETCIVAADADPLRCTITGLDNDTVYSFEVTATNGGGTSDSSDESSPVVVGPPAAPGTPVVVPGNGHAVVTITPATEGGTPDSYTVTADPGGATCTVAADADPLSCTIEGLDNGTTYTFTTTAANASGATDASPVSDSVTPLYPPAVPGQTRVSVGDQSAEVTVIPGGEGGPVLSYVVTAEPGGATCSVAADAPELTCTITGLDNDTVYTFTTVGVNPAGNSDPSESSPAVVVGEAGIPGPPTVSAGNGMAVVTVTPPTQGGTPDSYTVTASPGGETCVVAGDADPLRCTITGLDNDTVYSFEVTATNGGGTSAESDESSPLIVGEPAIPGTPTVAIGDGQAVVTVTPGTGGGTVDQYQVTANPGGASCTVAADADPLSCTVTGLDNGTTYTFETTATNSDGTTGGSPGSDPVTPLLTPATPGIPEVSVGNGQAVVTVTPGTDGGPVDTYTVTATPGGAICTVPAGTDPLRCTIAPLNDGETYTFDVSAANSATSAVSTATEDITIGDPVAPPPPTPANGDGRATVTVNPATTGGTPNSYTVTASPGGATCTVARGTVPLSCVIEGLENGTTYTFTTTAENQASGTDPSPVSSAVTPVLTPPVPGISQVWVGDGEATVMVTPGTDGGPVDSYVLTATPGGASCTVAATEDPLACTITGLVDGTTYTFTAAGVNDGGSSANSSESEEVVVGAPDTPGAPTVSAGDGEAFVTITPAAEGGTPASYTVTATPGGATCTVQNGVNPLGCMVQGLDNDETYSFTVTATNPVSTSDPAPDSRQIVVGDPGTPGTPTAVNGDGSATVTVTPPDSGGTPDGYRITASPGGAFCTVAADADPLSCVVEGLDNNTSYTFTATATNTGSPSGDSPVSNEVTPLLTPGVPGPPTVSVGYGQATVTIDPPQSGGPVSSYLVTASPGGRTCTVAANETPLECVVDGLDNEQAYTFEVAAVNAGGSSAGSEESSPAVVGFAAIPGTPVAANGDARAVVTVTPGVGGGTVDSYTVTATPSRQTCTVPGNASPLACAVEGLDNGTTYTFSVAATNAGGTTDISAPSNEVTPILTPAVPATPAVSVGTGEATVTVIAGEGGGLVDSFTVTASPGGASCSVSADVEPLRCTVQGLDDGTTYTFGVTATNSGGSSQVSADSRTVVVGEAGTPSVAAVSAGDTRAAVTVAPPTTGGTPDSYTVTAIPGGATCTVAADVNPLRCIVEGLDNDTAYSFEVTASNGGGTSEPSEESGQITVGSPTVPGTPTAVTGDGQAVVTITPSEGGGSVDTYTVTAVPGGQTCTVASTEDPLRCTVEGLDNGTRYNFTVVATNTAGSTEASPASNPVTPNQVPGTPGRPRVSVGNGQATVTILPPTTGGPATGYTVVASPGGATCTVAAGVDPLTCTVTGLDNTQTYTFAVTAANDTGPSTGSATSSPVTLGDPGVPGKPIVAVGDGSATVTIVPPTTGGTPDSYTVVANPGGARCTVAADAEPLTCIVTGLVNGVNYTFTVEATNGASTSPGSQLSDPATPSAAVVAGTVTIGKAKFKVKRQATILIVEGKGSPAGAKVTLQAKVKGKFRAIGTTTVKANGKWKIKISSKQKSIAKGLRKKIFNKKKIVVRATLPNNDSTSGKKKVKKPKQRAYGVLDSSEMELGPVSREVTVLG